MKTKNYYLLKCFFKLIEKYLLIDEIPVFHKLIIIL